MPCVVVERAVGLIEKTGRLHGVEHPIQMTVATTDGTHVWVFRYSSEGKSRSLFYSTDVARLRELHPELPVLGIVTDESRLIVSEPLRDLPDVWNEVPESSFGLIHGDQEDLRPFTPRAPSRPTPVPVSV